MSTDRASIPQKYRDALDNIHGDRRRWMITEMMVDCQISSERAAELVDEYLRSTPAPQAHVEGSDIAALRDENAKFRAALEKIARGANLRAGERPLDGRERQSIARAALAATSEGQP